MKHDKRIDQLERKHAPPPMPPIEVTIVDSREQVTDPDLYEKILDRTETGPSGLITYHYRLRRKVLGDNMRVLKKTHTGAFEL